MIMANVMRNQRCHLIVDEARAVKTGSCDRANRLLELSLSISDLCLDASGH